MEVPAGNTGTLGGTVSNAGMLEVGADATLWCRGRWTINGTVKAGLFHNSSNQNTILDTGVVVVSAAEEVPSLPDNSDVVSRIQALGGVPVAPFLLT